MDDYKKIPFDDPDLCVPDLDDFDQMKEFFLDCAAEYFRYLSSDDMEKMLAALGKRVDVLATPTDDVFISVSPDAVLSHHAFLLDFPAICIGRSLPFFVGCHSAARLGFTVTRSLTPSTTCLFEQWGHPIPLLLFPITASHSCPHVPFHQTFRLAKAVTIVGFSGSFLSDHSAATSGY